MRVSLKIKIYLNILKLDKSLSKFQVCLIFKHHFFFAIKSLVCYWTIHVSLNYFKHFEYHSNNNRLTQTILWELMKRLSYLTLGKITTLLRKHWKQLSRYKARLLLKVITILYHTILRKLVLLEYSINTQVMITINLMNWKKWKIDSKIIISQFLFFSIVQK